MKHKSVDYKLSAVKYYLNHEAGYDNTCKIFDCKKSSLKRWIQRYKTSTNLTRRNRKLISYKITKPQVKTALELLKQNEQLTMNELAIDMKKKYPTFDITPQRLGQVIRDNNKTRKRTRHEHFPKERYKKPIEKQNELNKFYSRVKEFPMNKIICLDETSVGSALKPTYSRCELGRRCVIKTSNLFVFRKFTLLVAISNSKCVGKELYEKGGMTKERLIEFLEKYVFPNYKDHLIILDNAGSHNNELIKNAIIKSGNHYLFAVPYTPKTDAIEQYFNQVKTYLKKDRNVANFQELENNVEKAIDKVKPENYKNYFEYAYNLKEGYEWKRNPSTRRRKLKIYK